MTWVDVKFLPADFGGQRGDSGRGHPLLRVEAQEIERLDLPGEGSGQPAAPSSPSSACQPRLPLGVFG